LLGQQITKTIANNLGSKEKEDEETTRSFNNGVSFQVDDLNEIKEYALSKINLEHELSQDESKPAAIPNKKPSAKPSAIPHKKPQPYQQPFHKKSHKQFHKRMQQRMMMTLLRMKGNLQPFNKRR
jgi:hypothetical protein